MSARPEDGEPLAQAMTRPTTLFGMTVQSLVLSISAPVLAFVLTGWAVTLLLALPLLLISYLVSMKDVHLFGIVAALGRTTSARTVRQWGCKTYAPR